MADNGQSSFGTAKMKTRTALFLLLVLVVNLGSGLSLKFGEFKRTKKLGGLHPEISASIILRRRPFLLTHLICIHGSNIFMQNAIAADKTDTVAPQLPAAPEEKSGLVVLRVAEVMSFQEKILRAVCFGDVPDVNISPQQIVYGTQLLLRNSNLDGNMRLMIRNDVPRKNRNNASRLAAGIMNGIQGISARAAAVNGPFKNENMLEIADMYKDVRLQLAELFDMMPLASQSRYFGYMVEVTQYEKKIADGSYNPDFDKVPGFN